MYMYDICILFGLSAKYFLLVSESSIAVCRNRILCPRLITVSRNFVSLDEIARAYLSVILIFEYDM